MYGLDGYKVHSKICLITRHIGDQIEYYTQIGTGNYNEKTARLYTDYCLLTANEEIGADAADVFRALALGETVTSCRKLMVARIVCKIVFWRKLTEKSNMQKMGRRLHRIQTERADG